MEKFGIFELLDALSALTAHDRPASADETAHPSSDDRAFRPPDYGQPQAAPTEKNEDALKAFLARHDAVAHKADHNAK